MYFCFWCLQYSSPTIRKSILMSSPRSSWLPSLQFPCWSRSVLRQTLLLEEAILLMNCRRTPPQSVNAFFVPTHLFIFQPQNAVICLWCTPLLRSMARSLDFHLQEFPSKTHYELSQMGQPRTTLKHGELPRLATSSTYVWSTRLNRTFSGKEKLRTLLFPLDKLHWTDLHSEGVLARMAGNGMCLPNVGWGILAHILCVEH